MAERIRLVMVGAGRVARDYLAALDGVPELELVAVVDADEEARGRAERQTGLPVHASVREFLATGGAAAALLLTPPASHDELCYQLLSAGLHVLCERPLAVSTSAASRMQSVAHRQERLLMLASRLRYAPDVVEAQRMLRDGLIGDVVLYEGSFCRPVDMTGRWNADPRIAGGGALMDLGGEAVDLVRFLLGPIVRVMAHFGRRIQPLSVEDTARFLFEAGPGTMGSVDVSWSVTGAGEHFASLLGSRGTLQVGRSGCRYRLHGQQEWTAFGSGFDDATALGRQLQDFAWTLRGDHRPLVGMDDAIESVRAIEAAYRAARVERWIPVHGYHGDFR